MRRKGLLQCPILSGLKRLKLIGCEKNYIPFNESSKSFLFVLFCNHDNFAGKPTNEKIKTDYCGQVHAMLDRGYKYAYT